MGHEIAAFSVPELRETAAVQAFQVVARQHIARRSRTRLAIVLEQQRVRAVTAGPQCIMQHHRNAALRAPRKAAEQREGAHLMVEIEVLQRLVEEIKMRRLRDKLRNAGALAFAARQGLEAPPGKRCKRDRIEGGPRRSRAPVRRGRWILRLVPRRTARAPAGNVGR